MYQVGFVWALSEKSTDKHCSIIKTTSSKLKVNKGFSANGLKLVALSNIIAIQASTKVKESSKSIIVIEEAFKVEDKSMVKVCEHTPRGYLSMLNQPWQRGGLEPNAFTSLARVG